ncbi:alkane 1-monooxygenase [Limimaricola litoreus]|uniref:Alkane 1-monooxygenase n=1 Tax=Limimaricola litoreus TaxID=2955316 RepID=A0A9X2FP37_9RHOB|nr:alkane 1-monooxygenase [Limimaricola litoreus]MCP1168701.1 alkane 1-monooxygenase [Limimaricola litoreus]
MSTLPATRASLLAALPYWVSLLTLPLAAFAAQMGGWWVLLLPAFAWLLFDILDLVGGLDRSNPDPDTPEEALFWHSLLTMIWVPAQAAMTFGLVFYATRAGHLGGWEKIGLFVGQGVISGAVGIVYAHELLHQRDRVERWLGDILLAMVLWSPFRSHHLRVHHLHVGTPADVVTARYNEGFHRHFFRVLWRMPRDAWRAEARMLARKGLGMKSRANPFWRYAALQAGMLALALALGGIEGLALFALQAFVAIWQLELVNYIEHYGLTRKHLGDGRYEPVRPRHSWNAEHRASNRLLINLQRHSDHHYKPDRRYPLLQTYPPEEAPQLPQGYPIMGVAALIPPLWRRMMNPRVRAWRRQFYPEISDWGPYKRGELPRPRGA